MKLLFYLCILSAGVIPGQWLLGSAGPAIYDTTHAISVFPRTVDEIDTIFQQATNEALIEIQKILSLRPEERTFENTVKKFDRIAARFYAPWCAINTIQMLHPDHILRAKAQKVNLAYQEFAIDHFHINQKMYKAWKEYQLGNAKNEKLNVERTYFLDSVLSSLRRSGMELDATSFEKMKVMMKEIALLSDQFCTNISQDHSSLAVIREDLAGLDEEFINTLQRDNGFYILVCDYPTRSKILENCTVASTRKAYYRAFHNRAFPQNLSVLNELVNKRNKLAHLLGYDSYADFDIEPEMAKTPNTVANFLEVLSIKAKEKAKQEWELCTQNSPESVTLNADRKMNPWDEDYLSNRYRQNYLQLNNDDIAKYFP